MSNFDNRNYYEELLECKLIGMKVLYYKYFDNSGMKPIRVYFTKDYEQAEKDLNLLKEYASSDKGWYLEEIEVYNIKKETTDDKSNNSSRR